MSMHACTSRIEPEPMPANLNPDSLPLTIVIVIPPPTYMDNKMGR